MIAVGVSGDGEGRASGLTPEFREASEALDEELHRIECVLHVAHQLALEACMPVTRDVEALVQLIEVSERATKAAQAAKDRAWRAQGGS